MSRGDEAETDVYRYVDRHALVMVVWSGLGFMAFVVLIHGVASSRGWIVLTAFALVLAAFVAHVIVNVLYRTEFSRRELGLGLVVYTACLVSFLLALLFGAASARALFVPMGAGFLSVLLVVGFYLVTRFGIRRTFDAYNEIRDFRG